MCWDKIRGSIKIYMIYDMIVSKYMIYGMVWYDVVWYEKEIKRHCENFAKLEQQQSKYTYI